MRDIIGIIEAADHPNVRAFVHAIKFGEGTQGENGYRLLFGGAHILGLDGIAGTFDDFADHPRQKVTRSFRSGGKRALVTSTAAGAGQFLERTWDGLVKRCGFTDFSPRNQDLGIVALVDGRKALDDVIAGRFEQAVAKCNKEWASLPGSPYGQPVVTMDECRREYLEAGGTFAAATVSPSTVTADTSALYHPAGFAEENPFPDDALIAALTNTPQETAMPLPAFLPFALQALIPLIPQLGAMFGSGSEVSQRNLKAAELVVTAAKDAIGARNEQELVESIASDPQAQELVKAAVQSVWYEVIEAGGGGIAAARAMNEKMASTPGAGFKTPAFVISLFLLPLIYGAAWLVLGPESSFSDEIQAMVVASIITGALGGIMGFWLGTSFQQQRRA